MDIIIGKGLTVNVDITRIAAHKDVMAHVQYIGLRNILMDAHASATEKEYPDPKAQREASLAMTMKKLESMYNGLARTKVASSGPSAFEKVMTRVFLSRLSKDIRTKLAASADKGAAWIATQIAANKEKVEGWAKEYVAQQAAQEKANAELAATLNIDISSL